MLTKVLALLSLGDIDAVQNGPLTLRLHVTVAEKAAESQQAILAPVRAFHIGHSLVGRDMPAMLQQLSGDGYRYESQLGWGTSLKEHWEPDLPIAGFSKENNHPRYRDAREAVSSGEYDVMVLTEMVEIKDAIRYHQSGDYFGKWADLARQSRPGVRIFLFESWPRITNHRSWLRRLSKDIDRYWKADVLEDNQNAADVSIIPAGQVMYAFARLLDDRQGIAEARHITDLFARKPDGSLDTIHLNDLGKYLLALTHYAAIYGMHPPTEVPQDLRLADGSAATKPSAELSRVMAETVWSVVEPYAKIQSVK